MTATISVVGTLADYGEFAGGAPVGTFIWLDAPRPGTGTSAAATAHRVATMMLNETPNMYRLCLSAVIAAAAVLLAACEPTTSLSHPRWEGPDYSAAQSDAYYQHDPLYWPGRGGP